MSSWESSLIDEYASRCHPHLAPLRQNAIRRVSKERTLSRHNKNGSGYVQSHKASKNDGRIVVFSDYDTTQSAKRVRSEDPSKTAPQQDLMKSESQLSPCRDDLSLPRRPPLAVLPVNRLPITEVVPTETMKTSHNKSLKVSYKISDDSPLRETRYTPRKVLWPTEHVTRLSRSTYTPIHGTGVCKPQPYQAFRPQKYRSPLKTHVKSTHLQRQRYHRTNLSYTLPISEREHSSCESQRYDPIDQTQARILQKSIQTLLTTNQPDSRVNDEITNPHKSPPQRKNIKLIDVIQRRLRKPLDFLHAGKSRPTDPPTSPKIPSFVVRSVARQQQPPTPSAPRPQSSRPEETTSKVQRRKLRRWEMYLYRIIFGVLLIMVNVCLLIVYLLTPKHPYLLAFLVLMKSKDLLSTIAGVLAALYNYAHSLFRPPQEVGPKWVASIICAYAESETHIMKTVSSLVKQDLTQHKQMICVILDGKPRDIISYLTNVATTIKRPYITWKGEQNSLEIHAGSVHGKPIILIHKSKNAGKKDTLVLGHSLFNYARDDAPMDMKLLRRDIWTQILPCLTGFENFKEFDYVYTTDADSTLHKDCLRELVDALSRNSRAIAACGLIIAQIGDGGEWSIWHLFQQFQYTFGQFVRRQAESVWGRVTCLPGPVTMVKVRPEMAKAISEYAAPVTNANIFLQQVQYQGTDRRFTWCMLAQGRHLQTILVPKAIGETIVPRTLHHYLSQRRRWAANAYFNDYMYTFGKHQHPFTRLFGVIDIIRMSFVYYRVVNTALFIRSLVRHFYLSKIIPTIIVTKSPTTWFVLMVLFKEPILRRRLHKIICGTALNLAMSPILSILVFSKVVLNLGNHAWGTTGTGAQDESEISMMYMAPSTPKSPWSPRRLVDIIKNAIQPSLTQNPEPEKPTQRHSTDSEAPKRTSTAASKTSFNSSNSEDPQNIPLPATPQTPTPTLPATVATPGNSLSTAARGMPDSVIRKRPQRTKVLTMVRTPVSKSSNPVSTPIRSSILVENPNPDSSLRKRARYPTFIVETFPQRSE